MVYYEENEVVIRDLRESDIDLLVSEENAQGYHADPEKYRMRLRHQAQGKSVSMVAEYQGHVAGYINVYPNSEWGAFGKQGYPEIVDFGVLEKYRRKGIGSRLMDTAERISAHYAGLVYLGVGMHSGYGSAQRMYVKRGYLPDGSGVWYGEQVCEPYTDCKNDDSLILYLSKKL